MGRRTGMGKTMGENINGTCDLWLGYTSKRTRRDLIRALRLVAPHAALSFLGSAKELRDAFLDEEPGTVGAMVGLSERGVSDVNLAAAIARDGRAAQVALVSRGASGSLRSRAARAGVTQVIDIQDASLPSYGPSQGLGQSTEVTREKSEQVEDRTRRQGRGRQPRRKPKALAAASSPAGKHAQGSVRVTADAGVPVADTSAVGSASVDDVQNAEGRAACEDDLATHDDTSPLITFVSGRGGVGKTTLVATCAVRAASWGMSVAVVDLDLSCGNLFSCFGASHGVDLTRLAQEGMTAERMGRSSIRLAKNVLLWGPCERPEDAEVFMPHVGELLDYLQSRFGLVLVDSSTTFNEAVARAAQAADRLVLVSGQEAGALASLARTSALAVRLGVARTRIVRVESSANLRVTPPALLGRAEIGLEGARLFRVADGGDDVRDLIGSGAVASLALEEGEFSDSTGLFLAQLLSELGRLPDSDAARQDLQVKVGRKRFSLFGLRKEA